MILARCRIRCIGGHVFVGHQVVMWIHRLNRTTAVTTPFAAIIFTQPVALHSGFKIRLEGHVNQPYMGQTIMTVIKKKSLWDPLWSVNVSRSLARPARVNENQTSIRSKKLESICNRFSTKCRPVGFLVEWLPIEPTFWVHTKGTVVEAPGDQICHGLVDTLSHLSLEFLKTIWRKS